MRQTPNSVYDADELNRFFWLVWKKRSQQPDRKPGQLFPQEGQSWHDFTICRINVSHVHFVTEKPPN